MANRTVLSDEMLLSDIKVLRKTADALEDIVKNDKPIHQACKEYGFRETCLRDIIKAAQPLKANQNKYQKCSHPVDYKLNYLLSPVENAYADIFCLDKPEMYEMELPPDLTDTLVKITKEALAPRRLDIFWAVASGATFEDLAKDYNLTRERIRQIYAKCLQILRRPEYAEEIKYGTTVYQKLKADKATEKERNAEIERLKEKAMLDAVRAEAAKIAESRIQEAEAEKREELESIIFSFLKDECGYDPVQHKYMDWRRIPIKDLGLSVRSYNCLTKSQCNTLADVDKIIKDGRLTQIRNLGKKSEEEIRTIYEKYAS